MNTIVQFDLIKLGEDSYCVDPTGIYIRGYCNINMLQELLTDGNNYLKYMREDLTMGNPMRTTIEIWEDSDDFRTWLDFKTLDDDFEIED